ncbi:MAG: peptidylprolyl isomerase [Arenicellales bacterium]
MLKSLSGLLAGFLLVIITSYACAPVALAMMLDRVLVVVNDDIITYGEFQTALNGMRAKIAAMDEQMPPESVLEEKVLEQLVYEKLLQLHAVDTGITVTDAMLDQAMETLAKQNNMSVPQVMAQLEQDGISQEEFTESLKNQLLVQSVIERDVKQSISVLDSEVDGVLRNIKSEQPDRIYNLSNIQLSVSEDATPAELEKVMSRAQELRQNIIQGKISFNVAAQKYSQAGNAADGGELGWKKADQLPALFADALKDMQEGSISAPLVSPAGIHLLKLNELKGSKQLLVEQTRARHILLRATTKVDIDHAVSQLQKIRQEILEGADFAVIATDISQDPGSAVKGGELGWLSKGETVPAFEQAMDALQVGEISQPVVSQFGVHLIQLQERRKVDVSEQKRRDAIRQEIGKRKVAEKYDQFLKQLKSRAYIDYRIPLDEI